MSEVRKLNKKEVNNRFKLLKSIIKTLMLLLGI